MLLCLWKDFADVIEVSNQQITIKRKNILGEPNLISSRTFKRGLRISLGVGLFTASGPGSLSGSSFLTCEEKASVVLMNFSLLVIFPSWLPFLWTLCLFSWPPQFYYPIPQYIHVCTTGSFLVESWKILSKYFLTKHSLILRGSQSCRRTGLWRWKYRH